VTNRVLRADAVLDVALGFVLLAATWGGLYDALGLPHPEPELFTQVAGGLLLAFGYLLWIAPRETSLTQAVSLTAAFANGLGAVVLLVWLAGGYVDSVLLWALVPVLTAFAVLEARIASRSVALLLPPD
jgi:hypothetical protein